MDVINVGLKPLIGKLNKTCRQALEAAAGLCLSRTHYEVDIEHLFLKLNEQPNTDFAYVLRHYEIDQEMLSRDLIRALEQFKTGNTSTPTLSPRIPLLIREAWVLASIEYNATRIRTGHLLLALLEVDDLARLTRESSAKLHKISAEELRTRLLNLVSESEEDRDERRHAPSEKDKSEATGISDSFVKARIFISYRHDDTEGWAGRLYDRLRQRFDEGSLFRDINTIEPGLDFVDAIEKTVGSCDVLIALIGRHWLESTDAAGHRRLDNPEDFVRLEIATALKRNIRVIPALVQGVSIPQDTALPDDLKPLSRRNALEISETHFDHDVSRLVEIIERVLLSANATASTYGEEGSQKA